MKKLMTLAGFGLLCATTALAQNTASFYNGGGVVTLFGNATGWRFTVNSTLTVNELGVLDVDEDGLFAEHNVGIFAVANPGVALASALIPAGTGATLIDGSRFVAIADLQLNAGTEYYILADNLDQDYYVYGDDAVSYSADVNWLGFSDSESGDITGNPIHYLGVPGDLGPNFRYGGVVPEPASMAALGLGAAALLRRRKK